MKCLNGQVIADSFSMYKAKDTIRMDTEHAKRKMVAALQSYQEEGERWKRWTQNTISDREAFNVFAMAAKCKFVLARQEMSISQLMEEPDVYKNRALSYL